MSDGLLVMHGEDEAAVERFYDGLIGTALDRDGCPNCTCVEFSGALSNTTYVARCVNCGAVYSFDRATIDGRAERVVAQRCAR